MIKNTIQSHLDINGFYIFKNIIPTDEIEKAKKNVTKDSVHYSMMEQFFKQHMLENVKNLSGLDLKPHKYRISNKNNNVDAAHFHRDLMIQKQNVPCPPIYTMLCYLDGGRMELIPNSQNKPHMDYVTATIFYLKTKQITIHPTDILLFKASIIHKGLFYKNTEHRRLIQLFDCIEQRNMNTITPQILQLPCLNQCMSMVEQALVTVSKQKIIIDMVDFIAYYNVASGYGANYQVAKKLEYNDIYYFSTDGNRPRLQPTYSGFEKINHYVINHPIRDQKETDVSTIRFYTKELNTFLTALIVIILFVLIIYVIINHTSMYVIKKKMKIKK